MRFVATLLCSFIVITCFAQRKVIADIGSSVHTNAIQAQLSFLAADEMRGRDTGSPELEVAANYLAAHFKTVGLKPPTGMVNYFQGVEMIRVVAPSILDLSIDSESFKLQQDIVLISGGNAQYIGEVVFIGYGTDDDFKAADVKGKLVVTLVGLSAASSVEQALIKDSPKKARRASMYGAAGLIEIMSTPGVPWAALSGYLSADRMILDKRQDKNFPHVWMRRQDSPAMTKLLERNSLKGSLQVAVAAPQPVKTKNVVAMVQGTDPTLKDQWIVLSAHYDHIGVRKKPNQTDSIHNGARDNAIGTVALMQAASYFAKNPPKRSLLLLALTAEERGLLGSEWYAYKPIVPLQNTVFNFNCDGAGYNDTTIATIIDFKRVTVDAQLSKGYAAFGLTLKGDPAPEQNLYERSDNFNFAVKGVPAVNISPGLKAFDQDIFKYYHQPSDEVSSLNFHYLTKFYKAYLYATWLVANDAQVPAWMPGDKFEEASKRLYKR
jgi:hypothetical protein